MMNGGINSDVLHTCCVGDLQSSTYVCTDSVYITFCTKLRSSAKSDRQPDKQQHCAINVGCGVACSLLMAESAGLLGQCFKSYLLTVQHTLQLSDLLSETQRTPAVPA